MQIVLYDPQRHEPLTPTPWNESTARQTIAEIVADTEASFDRESFWPTHPREDAQGILKGLYFGAAGMIWAVRSLAEKRGTRAQLDLADSIDRVCACEQRLRLAYFEGETARPLTASDGFGRVGFKSEIVRQKVAIVLFLRIHYQRFFDCAFDDVRLEPLVVLQK
jgi:hypothetical protein